MIITQLTDLHVRGDGQLCHGVADSVAQLQATVARVNQLDPAPDVALITGDLADDGSENAYNVVRSCLDTLRMPYFVVPGNHDDRTNFTNAFGDHDYLPSGSGPLHFVIDEFPVRLIGLDTTIAGKVGGKFNEADRVWLEGALTEIGDHASILFMHHPPIVTGICGLDRYSFSGSSEIEAVMSRHPQVQLIIAGHAHRPIMKRFAETLVVTSPSTAFQFACDLRDDSQLAVVLEPPAFLVHVWSRETGMLTHFGYVSDSGDLLSLAG